MRKKLLLVFCAILFAITSNFAQVSTVTGKVTDEKGKPIEGASVVEKKSQKGTVTDQNGLFKVNVKEGATLVISAVGYGKQEVTARNGLEVNASLKTQEADLSEVVVTALGIKREKKALGYGVSTVDKKDLEQRPEGDIARVLNGKAPGVSIVSTSGLSGSGTNINIRGISTITGNSQPLWIVDGVPFDGGTNNSSTDFTYGTQTSSRFLDLDPNNIESINILKGLSATTMYGSAGRNGVILVTTKNGSAGTTRKKSEVTVSQSYFMTQAILPEYNRSYGGGFDLSLGIAFFSNWGAKFTDPPAVVKHPYDRAALANVFPQFAGAPYYYKFYNSVHDFFRTGNSANTSINVNGSSGKLNYNMNYSYTGDNGYIPMNSMYKNTFGVGGSAKLTNNLTVSGTVNYVLDNVSSPPTSNSYGNNPSNTSVFGNVMYTPTAVDLMGLPWENPYDHSSVYYRGGNDIQNPRWTLYNAFTQDKVARIYGQMKIAYDLMKGLNLSYHVGFDNYTESQTYAQNKGGVFTPTGILRTSTGINTIMDHTLLLNFNRNLNSNFTLNVDGGFNARKYSYEQTGMTSTQQLVYGLMNHGNFITHDVKSENGSPLNYTQEKLLLGAFAQGQLGYKDYAYLNFGGRNDWASTVEQSNRSLFYPNVGVSFIPTSVISWLEGKKNVNYLKLRLGYSTSANFPDPYSTRPSLNIGTRQFLTSGGTAINTNALQSQLPNPDLKPELLKELEAGIEGRFFSNRMTVDLSLYNRVADNQILNRFLDPSTGYTFQQINAGKVTNKGIELSVGYDVIKNKNWRWHVDGLYTLNKSEVSDLPSYLTRINTSGYSNQGTFAMNGEPLGVIMGTYIQRDPKTGQRMVGVDGNYITANDIGIIGDPNALYKLTGISTLSYKAFSFRMQWDYTCGGDMYSGTVGALLGRGVTKDTEFDRAAPYILPGVLAGGVPNNIQISATQAYYGNSITNGAADETAIYDATCIRLREASLAYSLPTKMLSKLPFGSVSISISGSNLWYFAPNFPKYMHFDPESNGLGVGNGRGMEFLSGPSARRYGASVRVTF
ncbi:MAG: SusC/RagA family TonB-linked outer membrane protein [Bacteroidota bacterium]|nr:SusC/RagA family TonB-linked outer membrane protein [Bacteroidota bacterium]